MPPEKITVFLRCRSKLYDRTPYPLPFITNRQHVGTGRTGLPLALCSAAHLCLLQRAKGGFYVILNLHIILTRHLSGLFQQRSSYLHTHTANVDLVCFPTQDSFP